MRSLACVRRLIPAALVAAAACLGPNAARADEAEQLRGDIVSGLDEIFAAARQDKSFSYEAVDVQGSAPPYDVAIRGIRLGTPEAGQTELGTVSFRLAPVREGVYAVSDLKLPSPVEFRDASGGVSGTLSIGSQSFKGEWSKALRTFLSMDGSFTDIQGVDATGKTVLRIGTVAVNGDSTETTPDHWDQNATFKVSGLSAEGDTGTVSLESLEASSEVHGLDMPAVEKLRDYVQTLTAVLAAESAPFVDEGGEPQEPAGAEPQESDGGPTGNTRGDLDMSQDLPDEGMGDARPTPAEEAAAAH
ncbi:MAG: hypothetical protein IRY94_09325, partial [Rhodospirillaceae bacterium]|nr:hypothetical protein [Rhodospirillaceae bacterium]